MKFSGKLLKRSIFVLSLCTTILFTGCASSSAKKDNVDYAQKANSIILENDNTKVYVSLRPAIKDRLFTSQAVEAKIAEVTQMLTNARLRWMFENCFPNTIDTTVRYYTLENGDDDTLVYTGDIHAM